MQICVEVEVWFLCLVCIQCVISTDHDNCLDLACTCEQTRLMCNPHRLEGDQWEELQEIPTTLQEINLPTFEEADFRYNKIDAVKANSFQGLHNLNILWLSHNQVSDINSYAFNSATALQSIDLSHNNLETITAGAFSSEPPLHNLHIIDLSHNSITSLEPDCFRAIPNLKELFDVSGERIKFTHIIMPDKNVGQDSDWGRYLHYNPLTYLDEEVFDDLQMLNTLSLAHSSPRDAQELMGFVQRLSSLRLIFIAGIVENCTCDWLDAMQTFKARHVDIMDEHHIMTHCIEIWRFHCDVSHIHQVVLDELLHHTVHIPDITLDDIQPPVVRGNGTLVFPDGSEYELNSVEGKRALYQYDQNTHENIGQITDEQKRNSFQDEFKKRMTKFIRGNYVLNGRVDETGGNMSYTTPKRHQICYKKYAFLTISDLSPDDWEASLQNKPDNTSSSILSSASSKAKPASKKRKMRKGFPTSFIWLILGGLGCGLLVVCLVALQQVDWRDHSISVPKEEKRKKEKKKQKCCGWFGTVTGKLNVRKQFIKGTSERKHAKQTFARSAAKNNFTVLHGQAKEKMDQIQEGKPSSENFGRYTSPSNHIVPSQQAPPNLGQSSEYSANHGPPPAPPVPPTGIRRTSVDEGIRRMLTSQRNKVTGGQGTPSEGSEYFGNFYSDSEDDDEDADEETDLFRR